jgi:NADH:ubiquinone oxidoreductase subunit E
VMVVDNRYFGKINTRKIESILEEYQDG